MTKLIFFAAVLLSFSTNVLAEEDSYTNYDSIVNELKASTDEAMPTRVSDDYDWQEVALHGGAAIATSYVSPSLPNGVQGSGLLKGFELNFGMNLFTRKLRAEGAFSSYAQEQLQPDLRADLKEFELRMIYLPNVQPQTNLRLGVGIAARYLGVETGRESYDSSTPSSILLVGFERKVSPSISLGPDVSYRSALITDTIDKSAWDASFHLNATF